MLSILFLLVPQRGAQRPKGVLWKGMRILNCNLRLRSNGPWILIVLFRIKSLKSKVLSLLSLFTSTFCATNCCAEKERERPIYWKKVLRESEALSLAFLPAGPHSKYGEPEIASLFQLRSSFTSPPALKRKAQVLALEGKAQALALEVLSQTLALVMALEGTFTWKVCHWPWHWPWPWKGRPERELRSLFMSLPGTFERAKLFHNWKSEAISLFPGPSLGREGRRESFALSWWPCPGVVPRTWYCEIASLFQLPSATSCQKAACLNLFPKVA
jgi:hypothetical protein